MQDEPRLQLTVTQLWGAGRLQLVQPRQQQEVQPQRARLEFPSAKPLSRARYRNRLDEYPDLTSVNVIFRFPVQFSRH